MGTWTIGVDLGGTKLDVGAVDASGNVLERILIKTRAAQGAKAVVQDIIAAIEALGGKMGGHASAIGVGMAGQIDAATGVVRFAPNLKWHDVPLKEELAQATRLPVRVINDVRAAAFGEWLYGAGKGCSDLLCLFIGTGIGSGIVCGGKMLQGSSNTAGEVGHMTIDVNGPKCTCGNRGCFEALAGGWGIAMLAQEAVTKDPKNGQALLSSVQGHLSDLTAKHVFDLCRLKDPLALSIAAEVSDTLIAGIASLVNAFNPERVILGGGVIQGYPELIEKIREGVPKRALKAAVESLQIVQAQLRAGAGVIGAAAFAAQSKEKK